LDVELSRDNLPGTEQKTSEKGPPPSEASFTFWSRARMPEEEKHNRQYFQK
jgi:hypothetical protein